MPAIVTPVPWHRVAGGVSLVLALALCAAPASALDPQRALTQYGHRAWQTDEGLPQNSVFSVLQSREGYLWLATQEGLVRFDGVRFTVFNKANTPQIQHNDVWTLLEDRDGVLWAGTRGGGLIRLEHGRISVVGRKQGLSDDSIQSLAQGRDGSLWIGTRGGGLDRYHAGRVTAYGVKDGLSNDTVYATLEDRDGTVWAGTDGGGLNRIKDGKISVLTRKDGLSNDTIYALHQDRAGALWIGTGDGLDRYADGRLTVFTQKDGLSNANIRTIYEDRAGNLWVGTDGGGLNRYAGGKFSSYTVKQGLTSDNVGAIYEDREGSLWVGTDAGGLNRFMDTAFTSTSVEEGLVNDNARAIYEDRSGTLWTGTFGGLDRYRDGQHTAFGKKDGLSSDVILSLAEDASGALWAGTLGAGLNRYADGKFTHYSKREGLSNDTVLALLATRDGTLWIGTRSGGLNRLRDGSIQAVGAAEGFTANDVRVLYEDRAGALWIGTLGGGLFRYAGGRFQAFTTQDGLSNNRVLSIHEDDGGALWIGTFGGGLNRYKDGKFTAYTTRQGLYDDAIFQILGDASGHLWMSSNRGIFSVSRQDLNAFAEGRRPAIESTVYGKADGLRSIECNGAHQPAGWRTRDGRLWFPTIRGIVSVDPEHLPRNAQPPPVVLEDFVVDQHAVAADGPLELAPGSRKLEFHYAGLSFLAPEKVRFRYRLEGFDPGWVEGSSNRVAYYTNIPPGRYRFQVVASNNDGAWNTSGASLEFRLRPHFYQTWAFYLLCAAVAALLLVRMQRFYASRVRRLEARQRQLLDLVDERDRAQSELQQVNRTLEQRADELARTSAELERFAYVASHDLKEPLRSVISFTQLLSRKYSGQLGADADEYIGFAAEGALAMRRTIDNLLAYLDMGSRSTRMVPTDFKQAVDSAAAQLAEEMTRTQGQLVCGPLPVLPAHPDRIVTLFACLLDNALKFRSAAPPRIEVTAHYDAGAAQWRFAVSDNGLGIEPQHQARVFDLFQRLHPREAYAGSGAGLAICRRIVEAHGGQIWVEPGAQGGSVFRFTLPVAASAPA